MRSKSASELCTSTWTPKRADGEEEPRLQRGEGDERSDRDRVAAAGNRPAGEPVDERRHDGEVVWIAAIIQRPVMRLRTSRSARRLDSAPKRSARSPERPIVLPSRIPETDSDS